MNIKSKTQHLVIQKTLAIIASLAFYCEYLDEKGLTQNLLHNISYLGNFMILIALDTGAGDVELMKNTAAVMQVIQNTPWDRSQSWSRMKHIDL